MAAAPPRVVFDCVIYIQALINDQGPAGACVRHAIHGAATLFISPDILAEVRDVALRPRLARRYAHLTPEVAEAFEKELQRHATLIDDSPKAFELIKDAKDEPYINLAVAVGAEFLVTRDAKHLTYLMQQDTSEGQEFARRFPDLRIISPVEFLRELERRRS